MGTPNEAPVTNVEVTDVDVGGDSDAADEAAYQAEMAALRGDGDEEGGESDADLTDEDREYKEAMAKAKGDSKSKKETKDGEKSVPKKDEKKEAESKVWKLKVNGKEVEFDASDEANIKSHVQRGLAAQEKFEQSAVIEKRAKNFIEALRTNTEAVLTHPSLNLNVRKFCEDYLYKTIQHEMMTPEERAHVKEKEELQTFRQEEQRRKSEAAEQEKDELKARYRQDWDKKFTEALQEARLPKTDWTVRRMAEYMRQAIDKGFRHIQPKDVIDMVREDWLHAQKQMYSSMDGDQLIEMLGKDNADKIRKANLRRVETNFGKSNNTSAGTNTDVTPTRSPKKVYGSTEEMMRAMKR